MAPIALSPADAHSLTPPHQVGQKSLVVHPNAFAFRCQHDGAKALAKLGPVAGQEPSEPGIEACVGSTKEPAGFPKIPSVSFVRVIGETARDSFDDRVVNASDSR
jgi:hypothetical protein